jgi:hypothetical protein
VIFVILGMHKSGTTLISQILHYSGINMGAFDRNRSYDQGNQYERKESLELNMRILGCNYSDHSLDVTLPIYSEIEPDQKKEIIRIIESNCRVFKNWGFKDPRTCLTFDVWKKELPDYKVIAVFRDPFENWCHYTKKIAWRHPVRKITQGIKALQAWYIYNSEIIRCLEGASANQAFFIEFSKFMDSKRPFSDLEAFTDTELVDKRQKDLYRSKGKPGLVYNYCKAILSRFYSMEIDSLYQTLRNLTQ